MAIDRKATANWKGTGKEGSGSITTTSGVLNATPHSFLTRFVSEDGKAGTNPEELIAAAHASCFTMKLSFVLNAASFTADHLECTANVKMDKVGDGMGVVGIGHALAAQTRKLRVAIVGQEWETHGSSVLNFAMVASFQVIPAEGRVGL